MVITLQLEENVSVLQLWFDIDRSQISVGP
jgi:hypothetical protein